MWNCSLRREPESIPDSYQRTQRLEYRGYDSAGISLLNDSGLVIHKCKGKVSDEDFALTRTLAELLVLAYRWATHGEPNDIGTHPPSRAVIWQ